MHTHPTANPAWTEVCMHMCIQTHTDSSTHTQPDAYPHAYECAHEYIHIPQTSLPTPITYICRSTLCMYVYIHPWTYVPLFIYICKHAHMCKIYAERPNPHTSTLLCMYTYPQLHTELTCILTVHGYMHPHV